jgi:restriction system protein
MRRNNNIPKFDEMMKPLLKALKLLGGSGTVDEINNKTIELMNISDEVLSIKHGENGYRSEVEYRLAWTKTYLGKYGLINNSKRGIWALTNENIDISDINEKEIVKVVREMDVRPGLESSKLVDDNLENDGIEKPYEFRDWRERLKKILQDMKPDAFERLTQRLLRESGFIQVEVTGRTGDGGIDGKGIIRLNGMLSFHMLFQCKKYSGSVSPSNIRDFRGAMQGRADKGLFITTGSFTRDAIKEATRDGAPPIDLIDGDQLIDKLKDLQLGIKEVVVKDYEVIDDWFAKI